MPESAPPPETPTATPPSVAPPWSPRRPSPGRTPLLVVVIAVAVALVLSAVLLLGFGSGSSGASQGSGNGSTFTTARGVADQFASEHGTWDLLEGIGVALPSAIVYPVTAPTVNATCSYTMIVGTLPTNVTMPAFTGSLTSGAATVWLFGYFAPGVGNELAMFEVEGQVVLAVNLSAGCTGGEFSDVTGLSTSIVDSSSAVAAAAAAGGSAFLSAHPDGVSLTMLLVRGFFLNDTSYAPLWYISWSTCPSLFVNASLSSSGYQFSAEVNATTDAVVPSSVSNSTCGVTPPPTQTLGNALSLGIAGLYYGAGSGGTVASQGCTSGDWCYSVPIDVANLNIAPADFTMSVTNSTGALVLTVVGYAILNATGAVIVSSTGPTESQWTPGIGSSSTLLSVGMTFTVDMGTTNPSTGSYVLQFNGQGAFADSGLGLTL